MSDLKQSGIGSLKKLAGEPSKNSEPGVDFSFRSSRILIIIILIGVILAFFAGRNATKPANVPPVNGSSQGGILLALMPWLLVLFIAYFFVFRHLRLTNPKYVAMNNEGAQKICAGKLDEAEALYREIQAKVKPQDLLYDLAKWHLAMIAAERGKFEAAIPPMLEVINAPWTAQDINKKATAAFKGMFAEYAALSGQSDQMSQAAQMLDAVGQNDDCGEIACARAALAVRAGDYARAIKVGDEHWRSVQAVQNVAIRARFGILRAFSLQQLDATAHATKITELLANIKPFWKGQFAPLAATWSEMKAFLEQHKLTDEYASA